MNDYPNSYFFMYNGRFFMSHEYTQEYARKYIESTLASPYTVYKNRVIADLCQGFTTVWDLGGNVSGLIKQPGSLRVQLEERKISYRSIDLVPAYFSAEFAQSLGVDKSFIFSYLCGAVGDIQRLPLVSDSLEVVVSADVIEHIPDPKQAISEIKRVLQPDGVAIIVVPSLYKLDAIHPNHVEKKRYSSHENKLTFFEWWKLIEDQGLKIDKEQSRPLGILSGLLYIAWLDERFIPSKASQKDKEFFSQEAILFKKVKNVISFLDSQFDEILMVDKDLLQEFIELLRLGDASQLLNKIKEVIIDQLDQENLKNFEELIRIFSNDQIDKESFIKIQNLAKSKENLFLGNSTLFVARNK